MKPTILTRWPLRTWLARLWCWHQGRPIAALLLLVTGLLLLTPDAIAPLRSTLYDSYQRLLPRTSTTDTITVVEIDEASLKQLGGWPWPRNRLAALIDAIGQHQPAAIGLDLYLPEADPTSPEAVAQRLAGEHPQLSQALASLPHHDDILVRSLRQAPFVVLGAAGFGFATESTRDGMLVKSNFRIAAGAEKRAIAAVRHYPYVLSSLPELQAAAAGQALLSADMDNGIIRRVPLLATIGPSLVPGLATEMLRIAFGAESIDLTLATHGITSLTIGDMTIPTAADGQAWVHFSRDGLPPSVSAKDVLRGQADPARLHNKIILVGLTGSGLNDQRVTPRGDMVPGIHIQAELLDNMLEGGLLQRPDWMPWLELALLLGLGSLLIWRMPCISAGSSMLLASSLGLTTLGLGFFLFSQLLILDAASLIGNTALVAGSLFISGFITAQSQQRAAEAALQQEREASARLAGELDAARRIQLGSLPQARQLFGQETRFQVDALLEPARQVGGDLYDFFMLDPQRLFFVIADVSGKGLPAALFMAVAKAMTKSLALGGQQDNAGQILGAIQNELARDNTEMLFVTMLIGILDAASGQLQLASAGHDAPWQISASGHARHLDVAGGPPLCVLDDYEFGHSQLQLAPGDTLCLITDGITEALNEAGELYGSQRLARQLQQAAANAASITARVREDVRRFVADTEAADDLTLLAISWSGSPAPVDHSTS